MRGGNTKGSRKEKKVVESVIKPEGKNSFLLKIIIFILKKESKCLMAIAKVGFFGVVVVWML